jgi:hypothetical protein
MVARFLKVLSRSLPARAAGQGAELQFSRADGGAIVYGTGLGDIDAYFF